jgi:formylglycine-generating enzyme required for sulfatase activity
MFVLLKRNFQFFRFHLSAKAQQNYEKLTLSFFSLLLFAAAVTTATAQAKPKLAVFVVGMDDWKRGDVVAHIVGEELNRDKSYQVVTRSGAVQTKLKALRRSSVGVKVCALREWCKAHGIEHLCLITSSDNQNFGAQLLDMNNPQVQLFSGCSLIENFGAVDLKELAWTLTTQLRSGCPRPCSNYCEAVAGLDMVYVKGGKYKMGCVRGRDDVVGIGSQCGSNASKEVEVGDFWISDHEITEGEWATVMGGGYTYKDKPKHETRAAMDGPFIRGLNEKMGNTCMTYALPTEVQWEYAARGGIKMYERCPNGCAYSGSNNVDDMAVHLGNSGGSVADVKSKLPNELGIYDMSGNATEYCAGGTNAQIPIRGAGWGAQDVRIITQWYGSPYVDRVGLGFRVV